VTARSTLAPSVHSRAVKRWHPVPAAADTGFDRALLDVAMALAPASVVAVGNGAMAAVNRLRDRLPVGILIAMPAPEALERANDKACTAELARRAGVTTPEEEVIQDLDGARGAWSRLGAPMVLKSRREVGRKVVRYVRAAGELERAWAEVRAGSPVGVLAQEYIKGDGFGFSALYWNGRRVRHFMHRRVREWPPSGGTSACAESLPECPELERSGTALLDALRWHGVAMVEFKGTPSPGRLALMEVNAKFWGSHDLALAAGVDFPGDLVALMEGRDPGRQPRIRAVRFSWPLGGDLWHGVFRPSSLPAVLGDMLSPGVAHNFRIRDPLPHLYEAWQWLRSAPGARREFMELR
jgi:predicted ATP-grasp superfamily ATP-dependent carboligase